MKNGLIGRSGTALTIVATCFGFGQAKAQESWAGLPVPPAIGSSGTVSGSEYITADCNLRLPGNFRCADNPNAVREVFIPLSAFARADTVEVLKGAVVNLDSRVANVESRLSAVQTTVLAQSRIARSGIAASIAMGSASMPSAPGRTSYDFNLATFRGEHAIGGSIEHRLTTEEPMAVSLGISLAGHGNTSARVGIAGEF